MSASWIVPLLVLSALAGTVVCGAAWSFGVLANRPRPEKHLATATLCLVGAFVLLLFA